MKTITKEFNWSMSHLLENHNGLCSNLHGHNYRLFVVIERISTDDIKPTDKGMVVDFKIIKNVVEEVIVDVFDHSFCYNKNDGMSTIIAKFLKEEINQKLMPLPFRTTAENMAEWIYNKLNDHFFNNNSSFVCVNIDLYETEKSCASYSGDNE